MLKLSEEAASKGVITESSGNHGQAVARAAQVRGVAARVVMVRSTCVRVCVCMYVCVSARASVCACWREGGGGIIIASNSRTSSLLRRCFLCSDAAGTHRRVASRSSSRMDVSRTTPWLLRSQQCAGTAPRSR